VGRREKWLYFSYTLEAYLDAREQRAEEVRQRIERHQGDLSDLRQRLLARQQGS
jgi:hypothetical protein